MKIILKTVWSLIPENLIKAEIFLTSDDILQDKFSKKFGCYNKLFAYTKKTGNAYLNGH
ncbi:hypothetical protein [Caloranaerobacter azorensis]|nr:hypothetical protein [Caloranaerobacter azorensis]